MSDDTPQAPPSGELGQTGARAYDDQGNVRPADGRFLGSATGDLPEQDLQAIREEEIRRNTARLAEQRKAEEDANQERLEAAGYRNPSTEPSQFAVAAAEAAKATSSPENTAVDDRYTAMAYPELQAEASGRDGVKGNLPADDLRAALRADDAARDQG